MEMVNGYVFLDLTKANVYQKALKVLTTDKPVVVKDGGGSPYFVDSMGVDGTNVVITKGGKTITIANDNTITNVGEISTIMENIVDAEGNKRFIEGNGVSSTISGVSITYCKWSLSGSHIMFVLAGNIDDATAVSGQQLASFDIPQWILDKIYPTYNVVIENKSVSLYNEDLSSQNVVIFLQKTTNINMYIGTFTTTKERTFRVQFDLLIDTE